LRAAPHASGLSVPWIHARHGAWPFVNFMLRHVRHLLRQLADRRSDGGWQDRASPRPAVPRMGRADTDPAHYEGHGHRRVCTGVTDLS